MAASAKKPTLVERITRRIDGWTNAYTGLGDVLHDKTQATTNQVEARKQPDYYEGLFHSNRLARRVVTLPTREMFRQGFKFESDDTGFDAAAVMSAWRALSIDGEMQKAAVLARVAGGAALVLGADDGAADLTQPLNELGIKSLKWVKAVSRRALSPQRSYDAQQNPDRFGETELWAVQWPSKGGVGTLTSIVHESRLVLFDGEWVTDTRRAENQGWGDSLYYSLEKELQMVGTSFQALNAMLVDGSQGILKIKDLHHMVVHNDEGDSALRKRLRMMQFARSVIRAVVLDADAEDFKYAERSYAGVPDTIDRFMSWLATVTGIPVTLLFGQAPAGLGATGDSDIRFFYDTVKADQCDYLGPKQERVAKVLMLAADGPTKGALPANWSIKHNALWQLTDLEQATLRKTVADADALDIANQVITPEEAALSHYGGDTYQPSITIETDLRDTTAQPAGDAPTPDLGTGGADNVQQTVLNGAQVASLVAVVESVAGGEIPRESGVEIVKLSFGLTDAQAQAVLSNAGDGFEPTKPTPKENPFAPAAPQPPKAEPNGAPAPGKPNIPG